MRKPRYFLLVLCIALSLVGCGERRIETEEEMIAVISRELDVNVTVQKTGKIALEDVVLVTYITGNEYQAHTYGYAEFEKQKNNYKFLRTYSMMERGMDLRSAIYHDSYLFVINNEHCMSLRISRENGEEEVIAVDNIPFVYYFEDALNSNFEYQFLNKDGEEIRP